MDATILLAADATISSHMLSWSLPLAPLVARPSRALLAASRCLRLSYSGNWMTTCMTPSREGPKPE